MEQFASYFFQAKEAGLGVTLHIAEVIPFMSSFNRIVVIPLSQTTANSPSETLQLLSFAPNRLGHATFLDDEAKTIVLRDNICIEICLSSNLLWVQLSFYFSILHLRAIDSLGLWHHIFPFMKYRCKTVSTLDDHHIWYYLKNDHPIAICVCNSANSDSVLYLQLFQLNRQMIPSFSATPS